MIRPLLNTKRTRLSRLLASIAFGGAVAWTAAAQAQSGTWLDVSGNWSDTTKWTGGIIATGANNTANFTSNITAARTVTLDTARTIGNITFTDATTSDFNLSINSLTTEVLTLSATAQPAINVTQTGRTLTIASPLAGTQGLNKTGTGALTLSGNNSGLTGGITMTDGTLNYNGTDFGTGSNTVLIAGGTLVVPATAATNVVLPAMNVQLGRGAALMGGIQINNTAGATINTPINAVFSANNQNNRFAITGSGPLTVLANINIAPTVAANGSIPFWFKGTTTTTLGAPGTPIVVNHGNANGSAWASFGENNGDRSKVIFENVTWTTGGGADWNVADVGTSIGTVVINSPSTVTAGRLFAGKNNTSSGVVVQNGGTVTFSNGDNRLGGNNNASTAAVGVYESRGGTLNIGGNFQIGAEGRGSLLIDGGIVNITGGFTAPGRYANGYGQLTIKNGDFNHNNVGSYMIIAEQGTGSLNMLGGNFTTLTASTNGLRIGHADGAVGIVNLLNGNLTVNAVTKAGGTAVGVFNFNGGNLIAQVGSQANFMTGLTNAYVLNGGAKVDTNSQNITIAQNLIKPTGNGLATVPVATGGTGYEATPIVVITGGGGVGATAIANMTGGVVTGITIVNPGTGYTGVPTVTITGGNPVTAATLGTVTTAANTSTGGFIKNGAGILTLTGANNYTGVTQINAGTLSVASVTNGGVTSPLGAATSASANLVFNGGNLLYSGTSATTNRGFTINATLTGTIEVSNANANLNFTGIVTGGGNLTKTGPGTLSLSNGANTLTGTVVNVDNGTLKIRPGSISTSADVTVGFGANLTVFGAGGVTPPNQVSVNKASFLGGNKLNFEFAGLGGNPTVAALNVTGANGLDAGGTVQITVKANAMNVGTFPLIDYNTLGTATFGSFQLLTLPGRAVGSLVDNTVDGRIDLNITSFESIKWVGADPTNPTFWDINTTTNWKTASGNLPTNYLEPTIPGDIVVFDDTATSTAVALQQQISPTSVTFNNTTKNYTLSGQAISGATDVTKTGTGTLTLTNDNTFTGDLIITGGTVTVGNGATSGSILPTTNIVNDGSFILSRSDAVTFDGGISGTGNVTYNGGGTGVLTLTNPGSSYTGVTTLNNGTVVVSTLGDGAVPGNLGAATNAAGNLVLNGATLQYTGGGTSTDRLFTVGTAGATIDAFSTGPIAFTNTGAIALDGTNTARTITLTGNNTGANTFAPSIGNNGTGATNLVKASTGNWTLSADNTTTGTLAVNGGALTVTGNNAALGAVTVGAATLNIGTGGTTGNVGSSAMTNAGTVNINRSDIFTMGNVVSGAGVINLNGTGTVLLNPANTQSGNTFLNNGILEYNVSSFGTGTGVVRTAGGVIHVPASAATQVTLPPIEFQVGTVLQEAGIVIDNTAGAVMTNPVTRFYSANNANHRFVKTGPGPLTVLTNINLAPTAAANGTTPFFVRNGTMTIGNATVHPNIRFGDATNGQSYISVGLNGTERAKLIFENATLNSVGNVGTSDFNVSDVENSVGTVIVNPGDNSNPTEITALRLFVGKGGGTTTTGARGVFVQNGGTSTFTAGDSQIGAAATAVGVAEIRGGIHNIGGNYQVGANGRGSMLIDGGVVNVSGGFPVIGRFLTGYGDLTIKNGSFTHNVAGSYTIIGEVGTGVMSMLGGNFTTNTANAVGLRVGHSATGNGQLNLKGGTLTVNAISKDAAAVGVVNFNGGTLQVRSSTPQTNFMTGLTNAFVFSGGAIVDSNGQTVTIAQPLLAPNGSGVTTVPVTSGGTGYEGAPIVQLSGGGGTGATAIANLTGGVVTSITITNPGVGYTSAPTVTFSGGNALTDAVPGTPTTGSNTSGGFTKIGSGTINLTGASTFTGPTFVSAGKLLINGNNSAATGTVTVNSLATLGGGGTVGGSTNVALMGIVAPGNSAGNLTFAAGANFSSGGVYSWELGALSTANPGTDFDTLTVAGGNLALAGSSALTLDFGLIPATGPNSADTFWTAAHSWKIIDVTGGTNTGNTNLSTITNASYTSGSFVTNVGGVGPDQGDIFLVFTPAVAGPSVWNGANNDNWTLATSWTGSVPNSNTAEAKFVTTGGTTATLDADQTINKLTFDATAPHTISGANKLTLAGTTPTISTAASNTATQTVAVNLDLAAGTAVSVQGGTLELNSPANATLGAGVTATVANGATLSLGGTGNALSNGTTTHANVTNNGTLAATTAGKRVGDVDGTGTTTVTAASATLTANHIRQATLNIGAGNLVTVATNGGNTGTSTVTNLSINATGKLDLNDNDLIVDNGNLATLTAKLATGMDISGSYGNGPGGITSTTFANNPNFNTVLGIAPNSDLAYSTFSGQTVDANDVLIKYTYYGDADLNGLVDAATDFDLYITGLTSGGSFGGWLYGDFDYNGTVDAATDFDLYITGLTSQGAPLLTAGGSGSPITAIPEPSTLVLAGLGVLGFAGMQLRRRRLAQQQA